MLRSVSGPACTASSRGGIFLPVPSPTAPPPHPPHPSVGLAQQVLHGILPTQQLRVQLRGFPPRCSFNEHGRAGRARRGGWRAAATRRGGAPRQGGASHRRPRVAARLLRARVRAGQGDAGRVLRRSVRAGAAGGAAEWSARNGSGGEAGTRNGSRWRRLRRADAVRVRAPERARGRSDLPDAELPEPALLRRARGSASTGRGASGARCL